MMNNNIISVKNFSLEIRKEIMVELLTLNVSKGECVGICSRSGQGKSTILRGLALNIPPPNSTYTCFEVCQNNKSVGYLPQSQGLIPWMTLAENFSFYNDVSLEESVNIFKEYDIGHRVGSLPIHISGGEYQRAMLAIAIARKSGVFLLDEPLTGVDVPLKEKIIKKLSNELISNFSCGIIASHDLDLLTYLCQKICVIKRNGGHEIHNNTYSPEKNVDENVYGGISKDRHKLQHAIVKDLI